MAQPRTLNFGNFVILLGDGATPEVFASPCGFTQKSLKLTAASSSAIVPDCDDPEAATWTLKAVSSLSGQITGSGILAITSVPTWRAWFESGADKNIQLMFDDTGANGGGYYQGAAILTDFTADVSLNSDGNRTKISVTIDNDGPWAWTANA